MVKLIRRFPPRSDQDVLGHAFNHMTEYLHEIATMARAMARGDLRQEIQPRTAQDILGNALKQLISYVQNVADVAETISDGDLRGDSAAEIRAGCTESITEKNGHVSPGCRDRCRNHF